MTLEDIEVASVSLLEENGTPDLSASLSFSFFLPLCLKCLIRDEKYCPAFYFTDFYTRHF